MPRYHGPGMNEATIRIPPTLRSFTRGAAEVCVSAATVREALDDLARAHDGILVRLLDGEGHVRPFVKIFLERDDIHALDGLETPIPAGAEIWIVPAVAGG